MKKQRAVLHRKLNEIVRGCDVNGWELKHHILGILFYRFISERVLEYSSEYGIEDYNLLSEKSIPDGFEDAVKRDVGFFILPKHLFNNVVCGVDSNYRLGGYLRDIFDKIEQSAIGYPSEKNVEGIFEDVDTETESIGITEEKRNANLATILKGVSDIDFHGFSENESDTLGDAYEFLLYRYSVDAGKSGGEFYTPQSMSKLTSKLAMKDNDVRTVYDPTCGSGSLLLQAKKYLDGGEFEIYGQEMNRTTFNLARMNMFLHNVKCDGFHIGLGDTLMEPKFMDEKPFDAIVSNPPYSVRWEGSDNPALVNDRRFSKVGTLAPKSKADFAFILHALDYLSDSGRSAIVCFPGIFYRSGAEQKIRKWLVDNNYVEGVIELPSNLFTGTTITVDILIISKNKKDTSIRFVDASGEEFFEKGVNGGLITNEQVDKIVDLFFNDEKVENIAETISRDDVAKREYNLSVGSYISKVIEEDEIDIEKVNSEIKNIVLEIEQLRSEIDSFILGMVDEDS